MGRKARQLRRPFNSAALPEAQLTTVQRRPDAQAERWPAANRNLTRSVGWLPAALFHIHGISNEDPINVNATGHIMKRLIYVRRTKVTLYWTFAWMKTIPLSKWRSINDGIYFFGIYSPIWNEGTDSWLSDSRRRFPRRTVLREYAVSWRYHSTWISSVEALQEEALWPDNSRELCELPPSKTRRRQLRKLPAPPLQASCRTKSSKLFTCSITIRI